MNTLITEESESGHTEVMDVFSRLAEDRILFITDYIDDRVSTDICATLLLMDAENNEEKITLFINSEGGECRSIFAIYDLMELIKSPIETVCIGSAMNEAVLLLAAGTKRFATKNAVICPSQLVQEKYYQVDLTDAKATSERLQQDNKAFMTALGKKVGKKMSEVMQDFEKKSYLSANQALKYGLIDGVIGK